MKYAARLTCACALAAVLLTALPRAANAQMVVYDPANHAETILTAARALEQIRNQAVQIEQQAKMLSAGPLQMSGELAETIRAAEALLSEAEGLSHDLGRLEGEIAELYPETWADHDLGAVAAQSEAWLRQTRASVRTAMQAEARAAASAEGARSRVAAALEASGVAPGQTAAVQAGNQLLGVSAAELAEIHVLLAAQGRALNSERMERAAREARAAEIARRAFPAELAPPAPASGSAF